MKKIAYPNGIILEWDDTLCVGDLITAYEKGYHVLSRLEFRDGHPPIAYYVRVVSQTGEKIKKPGRELSCCASFVRRMTREDIELIYEAELKAAKLKRDNLLELSPAAS